MDDFRLDLPVGVPAGHILCVVGPSGAGKTTALRALAGLIRPDAGFIAIDGRTVYSDGYGIPRYAIWVPPHQRQVGYVTQQNHLFPHLTVRDNIAYGLSNRRGLAARQRVSSSLSRCSWRDWNCGG